MDLPLLLAGVERGDDIMVLSLLDEVPEAELLADDAAYTLLAAAAHAGRHDVVRELVSSGLDVTRPWADGADPVTWAADHGAYRVLLALLGHKTAPLAADSPHHRALRVAQAAIDAAEPAEAAEAAGPPPAHRAIISRMEAMLGIRRTPDELLARALVHAQPEHDDWFESLYYLDSIADPEVARWALEVARDTSSLDRRRFGLHALNFLDFGLDASPQSLHPDLMPALDPDHDEEPFRRETLDLLRSLLDTEQDPYALRTVIAAFTSYGGDRLALLTHADHPDPRVRRTVASELATDYHAVTADNPEVVATLLRLTADPVPEIRAHALYAFVLSPVDTPELRDILAAHLTDPHSYARTEAAGGLALRGDERGLPVLDEIGRGIKYQRDPLAGRLHNLHYYVQKSRADADSQGRP